MSSKAFVLALAALAATLPATSVRAVTIHFFRQPCSAVTSAEYSDTVESCGYRFTYSLDKYWCSGIPIGGCVPTGRPVSVIWPAGLQAQAITVGPNGQPPLQNGAGISVTRVDGRPFDLTAFTGKIMGSTAGAGASFEIMPTLNGVDGFPDPLMFDATGYAGQSFPHTTSALTGFDTYHISLWMDFALTSLTLIDPDPPVPVSLQVSMPSADTVRLSWPALAVGYSLQASPDVESAHFAEVNALPVIDGANVVVTLPLTDAQRLYRLAQ